MWQFRRLGGRIKKIPSLVAEGSYQGASVFSYTPRKAKYPGKTKEKQKFFPRSNARKGASPC